MKPILQHYDKVQHHFTNEHIVILSHFVPIVMSVNYGGPKLEEPKPITWSKQRKTICIVLRTLLKSRRISSYRFFVVFVPHAFDSSSKVLENL